MKIQNTSWREVVSPPVLSFSWNTTKLKWSLLKSFNTFLQAATPLKNSSFLSKLFGWQRCLMKITENLATHIPPQGLFMVQNTIRSCYHNIAPLHCKIRMKSTQNKFQILSFIAFFFLWVKNVGFINIHTTQPFLPVKPHLLQMGKHI